ncbi:putative THUMP [Lyophyllum shimeji]|uniref:THUMP n=1 Tax=Lyophyllum shimeji TaxID=47721 RepID=A0A9P3PPH5_LYOSH|nr:putative THUMP [Lyophyllum shimeji]
MADTKRPSKSGDKKKRKYRSDGTPIWAKRYIDGPGIWVSCVKGKERQTVAECYDLFDSVASELWPIDAQGIGTTDSDPDDELENDLSIEAQIASEVSAMKRSKAEPRFVSCQTNTPCVVFISCKPPIDPVKLVTRIVEDVEATGVVRSRCIHRLVPVSGSCGANLPEIQALCRTIVEPFFAQHPNKTFKYKIELRVRNHSVISRPDLIQHIAQCVPEGHTVELTDPEIFILVEVFKNVCGISVVEDYYAHQKFNMTEIAKTKTGGDLATERQFFSPQDPGDIAPRNKPEAY